MDRRSHFVRLTLGLVLITAGSCGSDMVEVPDELRGEPACMWIMDSWMHFADGSMKFIHDEPTSQTGAVCACLTEQEFESQSWREELNDRALTLCEELADRHEHEWNECQQNHDEGVWLDQMYWSAGDLDHPSGTALGCVGE
jgi:hypothetical protein